MTPDSIERDLRPSDYLLVLSDVPAPARAIIDKARIFIQAEVLPIINEKWEKAEFPFELIPKLRELGVAGTTIQGFGCAGMSRLAAGLLAMEIARGDGSVNTFLAVQSGLVMGAINMLGDDEQRQRWLPGMASLDLIGAFGLTEPDHGSDSVALKTTARREGDSYILNGQKKWIGNGSFADVTIIWARDTADDQVKGFIVERNERGEYPPGYEATVIEGKVGKRAVLQAAIQIREVAIPVSNRLVNSSSFKDVTRVLSQTRVNAAWEALGHAMAAYDIAVEYAKTRIQFGKPIASFQLVQHQLANMLSEIAAIQLLCLRVTELIDAGRAPRGAASLAKMHAAQKARWVCTQARDLLGGNGLLLENHIARHLTDMEVVHTYEGTDSIQALIVGRDITGVSAFA
jgi:glutaryl-CoA dehydrogenase